MRKKLKNQNAVRSKHGTSEKTITLRVTRVEWLAYKVEAHPYTLSKWMRKLLNKASGLDE